AVAFVEDEFRLSRAQTVTLIGLIAFAAAQPVIFFLGKGVLDEMDFWGGTFALVLFGTIETVLFGWVFGIDKAWEEMHRGAEMGVPRIFRWIMKYVTPTALIVILAAWFIQQGIPLIMLRGVPADKIPYMIATRCGLTALFLLLIVLVNRAWRHRKPYEAAS
ncbi:MAG: sodium:calcium symporter, partial [Candidatus Omnitrophica bacterium]|nr:sodium:calcium symporter [Candidatus Omnitrophota bacterium]